jgi:hypothetical protein
MTPFSQRWDFWSRVALKDGGDDGGGGDSDSGSGKFTVTNPVTGDVTRHSTKAAAEAAASSLASDLGTTVNDTTFEFEGPMPGGQAGYMQDVSTIGVDPNTGFLTGDDDDNDFGMTTGTPLDTSAGIESLLPPPAPRARAQLTSMIAATTILPTKDRRSRAPATPKTSVRWMSTLDTGFITEDQGVDYTPPPPPPPPLCRG